MKASWLALVLGLGICFGCGTGYDDEASYGYDDQEFSEEEAESEDSYYSSETRDVEYYNPNTGYSADYELDVEMEGDRVERINFDNGGYLEGDWFDSQTDNGDGTVTVEYEGREFTVEKD